MSKTHKDIACKRLRAVGLSKAQALGVLDTIQSWINSNGHDWTISRLKKLKVAYINKLGGKDEIFSPDSWIAHTKFAPKGALKCLFSTKRPQKSLTALMVYSQYVHTSVTREQWKKFESGVTSTLTEDQSSFVGRLAKSLTLSRPASVIEKGACKSTEKDNSSLHTHIAHVSYRVQDNVRYDTIEQWTEKEIKVPYITSSLDEQGNIIDKVVSRDCSFDTFVESLSVPIVSDYLDSDIAFNKDPNFYHVKSLAAFQGENQDIDPEIMGRIGFIQEPGGKLRTVANPFQGIQFIMSRLGNQLYPLLRDIPNDFTFRQDDIVNTVQEFWKNKPGTTLMSIDLSSATDLFPLELQTSILAKIGISERDIGYFKKIARGKWVLPDYIQNEFGKDTISWSQGQPLGLYPSFATFALTHHALARKVRPQFYCILGDDIIIDYDSGRRLIDLYSKIGCKISWDKTITSNKLCEFGGKLITPDKFFIQPKWKAISDNSFIQLAQNLGPKSISMFTKRQQRILKLLDPIPKELSPYGLGWNSKGLPYDFRQSYTEALKLGFEENLRNYISKSNRMKDLKVTILSKPYMDYSIDIDRSSSKESDISSLESLILYVCRNDYIELPEEPLEELLKSFKPETGIRQSDPRGVTTLMTIEEKLKRLDLIHQATNSLKEIKYGNSNKTSGAKEQLKTTARNSYMSPK